MSLTRSTAQHSSWERVTLSVLKQQGFSCTKPRSMVCGRKIYKTNKKMKERISLYSWGVGLPNQSLLPGNWKAHKSSSLHSACCPNDTA